MRWFSLILISLLLSFHQIQASESDQSLPEYCQQSLLRFRGLVKNSQLDKVCARALQRPHCSSKEGRSIFHFDQQGKNKNAKNILVISLIHGDETAAGVLGRYWTERLLQIEPRNNWRIIPVSNPDGVVKKTRTNANGIDLNRNFPTKDWDEKALAYWKKETQSAARRFPGEKAASETEVQCLLEHIEDFKPQFVVSIHTPLNVLDFDGPQVKFPHYDYLPWKRLGNFPGSLGRFMWVERNVPVLTAELKQEAPKEASVFEKLQDIIGQLVLMDLK